jgi:ferritin
MPELKQNILEQLNAQIHHEFESSYIYLGMSAYFDHINLPGFAQWMVAQSQEETDHGMRMFHYVNERGGKVVLSAIAQPPSDYKSPKDAIASALKHEKFISQKIHELYGLASSENDYATQTHLHWFIDEQVEEERNVGDLLATLERIGDQAGPLVQLDRHLTKSRTEG